MALKLEHRTRVGVERTDKKEKREGQDDQKKCSHSIQ